MQFLITNNGAHPADKWAELTTKNILDLIQISEDETSDAAVLAERRNMRRAKASLSPVLFAIFEEEFEKVQKAECTGTDRDKHKRLEHKIDPAPVTAAVMARLETAFAATPFAAHFAQEIALDVLRRMVAQYMGNVIHIERSFHADRHPDTKEARAFRARHQG